MKESILGKHPKHLITDQEIDEAVRQEAEKISIPGTYLDINEDGISRMKELIDKVYLPRLDRNGHWTGGIGDLSMEDRMNENERWGYNIHFIAEHVAKDLMQKNEIRSKYPKILRLLQNLDEVWDYYRKKGSGKSLSQQEAGMVYKKARCLTVISSRSDLKEEEVVVLSGVSWKEIWYEIDGLGLTGRQKAGLKRRASNLADMARGEKEIPWSEKTRRRKTFKDFLPRGRLVEVLDGNDPRYIEREFDDLSWIDTV